MLNRRKFSMISVISLPSITISTSIAQTPPSLLSNEEKWMSAWMETKGLSGNLFLSRFKEPVYFLIKPIGWKPTNSQPKYAPVTAPAGFVSDLASIPKIFWSVLKPDGDYAYAAIIHDFLYWDQSRPKKEADHIFKLAMEDLEVSPKTVTLIFEAVDKFGHSAWEENKKKKASGERRVLAKYPEQPTITWEEWKSKKDIWL